MTLSLVTSRASVLILVITMVGCGDDSTPPPDGGTDTSVADTSTDTTAPPRLVDPPGIAWWDSTTGDAEPPYQELACSDGFRLVTDDDISICEPWPEGGRMDCPFGEGHFPGTPGCAPLGAACPLGDFPEGLPTDVPVLYVDGTARGAVDGTLANPYRTVGAAISAAASDTVVAIAKGTYDESLVLRDTVTLRGACAAETIIAPSGSLGTTPIISIDGAGAVRDLGVRGDARGIVLVSGFGNVTGVHIAETIDVGLVGNGTELRATRVLVPGTRRGTTPDVGAVAIQANAGRTFVSESLIVGAEDNGLVANGAVLFIDGVSVSNTVAALAGGRGRGLRVEAGSDVMGSFLIVEGSTGISAIIAGPDTTVELSETIFRDTEFGFGGRDGIGMMVGEDATVQLSRTIFERHAAVAIRTFREGASILLNEFLIRDIEAPPMPLGTTGGVLVLDGSLTLTSGVIQDVADQALLADSEAANLMVRNVLIRDVGSSLEGRFGRGIGVQLGATATIESTVIQRTRELGIFIAGLGAAGTLTDVVIADTLGEVASGHSGRALTVESSGRAMLERVQIDRSHEMGLIVIDPDSSIVGQNVAVQGVQPRVCSDATCEDEPFGMGLGSYYGATLDLSRFRVADADLCGLQLAEAGSIDLAMGEVSGSQIGACVQIDGYDLERLSRDVAYRDNSAPIESTTLPVPEPNG